MLQARMRLKILYNLYQMEDMLNDAFGFARHDVNDFDEDNGLQDSMGRDEGTINLDTLLKNYNKPSYVYGQSS